MIATMFPKPAAANAAATSSGLGAFHGKTWKAELGMVASSR
jgi:hypothetical protein